jgi:hypothetical protein
MHPKIFCTDDKTIGASENTCYIVAIMDMRPTVIAALAWLCLFSARALVTAQEKVRVAIPDFSASYISMHIAPSRAVLSQQTWGATPVIAIVSRPNARSRFFSCVP